MFNNEFQIHHINQLEATRDSPCPSSRPRVPSECVLGLRLPSARVLDRESLQGMEGAEVRQLRRTPSPPSLENESAETQSADRENSPQKRSPKLLENSEQRHTTTPRLWKDPAPYEIFRAIENKDLTYLMEVRDRAFHLLLRKSADATPLLHAMRIGDTHRDVAIVLLGAFSRWVNHLEDEDMEAPQTRLLLKALRTNLKIAIDYGLQQSQSDLLASFLQTLIMSEGDKWVTGACSSVSVALRAGVEGKPVITAERMVRAFATKELGKAEMIASLEEYIANATSDLLVLGLWSNAMDRIDGEPIPSYYFARDDRVFKAFQERLELYKRDIDALNRRLRWQIRVICKVLAGRAISYRRKVDILARELDDGPGV